MSDDIKVKGMKYKLGMYLGRFQPFHNGHKSIVDKMLEECEQVIIVIGSSDKKGTVKNPFPAWERFQMIKEVYSTNRLEVICLPDRPSVSNDSFWGDYVMSNLANFGFFPDVVYQGREVERCTWWANYPEVKIQDISRLDIPISATLVRAAIIEKREDFIKENCPPEVANHIIKSIYYGRDFHE